MNVYKIKIDGKHLAGFSDSPVAKAPSGAWYDKGKNVRGLVLVDDTDQAKKIDGNLNLKSYLNRIYEIIRYSKFNFCEITIEKVGEE